jgi:16S rRNA (cytidine1402-2'-O)-methyltransferase
LAEVLGNERKASVSREISKLFEETKRGTLQDLSLYYTEHNPKGEIVVIVAGLEE